MIDDRPILGKKSIKYLIMRVPPIAGYHHFIGVFIEISSPPSKSRRGEDIMMTLGMDAKIDEVVFPFDKDECSIDLF